MHIGDHEAGHLKECKGGSIQLDTDENRAWTKSNRAYAKRHRPRKKQIVAGKTTGLFELLQKPTRYGDEVTIGKIVKWGLVSHSLVNNAHIPKSWESKKREIMREFRNIIASAHDAFEYMMRRDKQKK